MVFRWVFSLTHTHRDLHLDDVTDVTMLYDTKFLVKRATDAIMLRENDAKDTSYGYS